MPYPYTPAQLEAIQAFASSEIERLRRIKARDSFQAQHIRSAIYRHLDVRAAAFAAQDSEAEGGFVELDAAIGESQDYNRILGALEVAA